MGTLLDDLDAFYLEHRRCGELDGGVEGDRVWITCECGAGMARRVSQEVGGAEVRCARIREAETHHDQGAENRVRR